MKKVIIAAIALGMIASAADTADIKGNYITAFGCEKIRNFYGMAEDAWKIIESNGKYYKISFSISCGKNIKPNFITAGGSFFDDQLFLDLQPITIQGRHRFTDSDFSKTYMRKDNNIMYLPSKQMKEKYRKYLLALQHKKTLSEIEQKKIEKIKKMLNPDGYLLFSKPTDAKYQKVFDNAPTYAMMQAINKKDIYTVKTLLKSHENINACVADSNPSKPEKPHFYTPYEIVQQRVNKLHKQIIKENTATILKIYQLFKKYGQTSICRNSNEKFENAAKEKCFPPIKYTPIDKEVLNIVKRSLHTILDRNIKAFSNITDSGKVFDQEAYERIFGGSDIPWKKNFPYLDGVTHADIDTLQIYKKANRDREHTCRYMATGKKVPCKSLEFCFTMRDKTFPNKGCLDMYSIQDKIYWEPFGW